MTTEDDSESGPMRNKLKFSTVVFIAVLIALVPAVVVVGVTCAYKAGYLNLFGRDRVAVYQGGDGGAMSTPEFNVEHDWIADIESTGTFRSVTLTKRGTGDNGGEQEGIYDTPLFDPEQPTNRITTSVSIGGTYVIRFEGDGAWRAAIRRETYGK